MREASFAAAAAAQDVSESSREPSLERSKVGLHGARNEGQLRVDHCSKRCEDSPSLPSKSCGSAIPPRPSPARTGDTADVLMALEISP